MFYFVICCGAFGALEANKLLRLFLAIEAGGELIFYQWKLKVCGMLRNCCCKSSRFHAHGTKSSVIESQRNDDTMLWWSLVPICNA